MIVWLGGGYCVQSNSFEFPFSFFVPFQPRDKNNIFSRNKNELNEQSVKIRVLLYHGFLNNKDSKVVGTSSTILLVHAVRNTN